MAVCLLSSYPHSQLEGLSLNPSTADDDIYKPQKIPIGKQGSFSKATTATDTDTEAEDILIEIESRKLKERRAHEEIKSGRFRHPNILTSENLRCNYLDQAPPLKKLSIPEITDGFSIMDLQHRSTPASVVSPSSTDDSSRSASNASEATTNIKSGQVARGAEEKGGGAEEEEGVAASSAPLKIDITAPSDDTVDGCSGQQKNISCAISTLSTSEYDLCIPSSLSCETTTGGIWVRSESINSVPSWASTISLDSQSDEAVIEFIRRFLAMLFDHPDKISLEAKAEFGQVVRVCIDYICILCNWVTIKVDSKCKSHCADESRRRRIVVTQFSISLSCVRSILYLPASTATVFE